MYPGQLADFYFGYLNLIEFTWFVFARTRLTLKYYPKFVTGVNFAFLVYVNSYDYAASIQFLLVVFCFNLTVLLWFMKECEVPGVQKWNPFDENTPSPNRPRIGYHHTLNDTTYGTGLFLWTALIPLQARSSFSIGEAAEGAHMSEFNRYFLSYNPRPR